MVNPARGVLYPDRLPAFHRLPAPPSAEELVDWIWIPEWKIEPGGTSRQEVVAYPALNLVVERDGVSIIGATTRLSHRDLVGSGWAVGALLRPAAVIALVPDPAALRDGARQLDAPGLLDAVRSAMATGEGRRERAASALAAWLSRRVGPVPEPARQANAMADLLMGDPSVRDPEAAAARLSVSVRTLQRMAHRAVGLPPAAMIRRRRLQEAAALVREGHDVDLATIAADLGYADHAHLTNDFRAVLGFTPSAYRAGPR
ncbi:MULTISPECIES: helix-turn-helix domain-containing protein [Bacteria]|uniref:AraC family transcriptional regulator n=1 Tax=Bacteria TaxID=2 RepID=UPI003C7CCD65